jgi:DNA-binding transcriptional LysR family regulator
MDPAKLWAIDLNLLVVLDVLLAERNVTRAASRLGLTQPAVSNALSRLRDALGDPLLVRTPHGMMPTPHALAIEAPLRDALERMQNALSGAEGFEPRTSRRTFVLAATDYVQFVLLGALVERIHHIAPNVALRVLPMTRASSWDDLETSVELMMTGAPKPPRRLHRRSLFDDRVVALVRAEKTFPEGAMNLARYLEMDHIEVLPMGGQGLADEVLAKEGRSRKVALMVPHFLVAPFILLRGDYCFTLAERIARPMADLLPLSVHALPFEAPRITIWAYWHARVHSDPAHRWLRRQIALAAASVQKKRSLPTRTRRGE